MRVNISEDVILGPARGDLGTELPSALSSLPLKALRWNGEAIVDAREITDWFVDDRGRKHLSQDEAESRQPITCAWNDRLIRDGEGWRMETASDRLPGYLAAKRWEVETAGISVNGRSIRTDRESQAMISGAYLTVQRDPERVIRFKSATGFVDLSADAMGAVADAVAAHVQACFDLEAELLEKIMAGEITSESEIDAAFVGLALAGSA